MFREVVECFFPGVREYEINPYGKGHINDTYKLELEGNTGCYILQRINTKVFINPELIAETHLKTQQAVETSGQTLSIPLLVPTASGRLLCYDKENNAWRLTTYIRDSYTIEIVSADWQAFEAGNAFGWFARSCDSMNVTEFREPIKDFHRLSFRLQQLKDAIARNASGKLHQVTDLVEFYKARELKLLMIEELVDAGKIPLRIVHNDTKINNLLFRNNKASTVIDLDTVGPGIIYYDYGDALRTTANTAAEDEKDLDRVAFDLNRFCAFTRGYLGQTKAMLTGTEKKYMHLAPVLMTYIMGIRFISDFLNGGIYYKTSYKEQNADRSGVQKKLIESMESREDEMKEILKNEFQTLNPESHM